MHWWSYLAFSLSGLFGLIGAIFAIAIAGSLQVFAKEFASESRRDHLLLP